MKINLRANKAISLMSLCIAIIMLVIITNILVYRATDGIDIKSLSNMKNDITLLQDKVGSYYRQYGKIPAEIPYTNVSVLNEAKGVNDNDNYYVIDLKVLEGITLNYGRDYENITIENANNYTDVYIINEQSHQIYYPEGVEVDNIIYYGLDKDVNKIELEGAYVKATVGVISTTNSTIDGSEPSYKNPIIPKGFMPVNEGTANWAQLNYEQGLVIQDEEGNQFVWIAVDEEKVSLNRYAFDTTGTATAQDEYAIDTYFRELAVSTKGNMTAKNIDEFRLSVSKYGGYYIARFEASYGTDEKVNSIPSIGTPATETPTTRTEGQLWNYISQTDAATVSRNMYNENYGVESDLMNSYAWDTALTFIQSYSGNTDYSIDQTGNIGTTVLQNTGATVTDVVCNIYDLSGNVAEWTTETSSYSETNPYGLRGGNYSEVTYNASTRYEEYTANGQDSKISFRPILYIK